MKNNESKQQRIETNLLNPQRIKMSKKKAFFFLTIGAFVGAFSSYFFMIAAHLYSPGLGGISSGISYVINDLVWAATDNRGWWEGMSRSTADSILYWAIYWIVNAPVIYLGSKWFTKRFIKYSIYYFIINFITSMLFANIPGISEGLLDMDALANDPGTEMIVGLFFAFLGGLASGFAVGTAFKVGACTLGLDPIVKHISREKNINIGPIFLSVSIVVTATFVLVRAFLPRIAGADELYDVNGDLIPIGETYTYISQKGFLRATFFSPQYIGSWIFIAAYTVVADSIYSSSKKVEVLATTDKATEISEYLNNSAYHRGHTLVKLIGGYSKEEKQAIMMVINYDEMFDVVEKIAAMDHKAFISVKEIFKLYDIHNWTTMTEEDKEKERLRIVKKELHQKKIEQKKHEK